MVLIWRIFKENIMKKSKIKAGHMTLLPDIKLTLSNRIRRFHCLIEPNATEVENHNMRCALYEAITELERIEVVARSHGIINLTREPLDRITVRWNIGIIV
jgi:hypothetical protein